jgi:hypothetical protein
MVTSKEGILQSPKMFEMKGLHNHPFEPRSKMEKAYLGNSYLLRILLCQGIISHHYQASNGRLWKIHSRNIFNISITLFLIKSS